MRDATTSPVLHSHVRQANASVRELRRTRLAFLALCAFLLVQFTGIPLRAVGPSWAIWPTLSDVAVGFLALSLLINRRHLYLDGETGKRQIQSNLLFILVASIVLFALSTARNSMSGVGENPKVTNAAIYQIFRTAEFVIIYIVAAGLPLNSARTKILSQITGLAIILTAAGIIGTYTSVIETWRLVAHLPTDPAAAGPWASLWQRQMHEVGLIGYNHSYTALQVVMLTSLKLSLSPRQSRLQEGAYLLICIVSVFLSGSRAGLVAALVFLALLTGRRPGSILAMLALSLIAMSMLAGALYYLVPDIGETIERQFAIKEPFEADNLSGRQEIWQQSYDFLQAEPLRWAIGAGPGAAAQFPDNAHMLYMHIVMETGMIGLTIFLWMMYKGMLRLRRLEKGAQPVLLVTWAFLVSSLTQETFYPVPGHGHFLGLYVCAVALVLRPREEGPKNVRAQRDR